MVGLIGAGLLHTVSDGKRIGDKDYTLRISQLKTSEVISKYLGVSIVSFLVLASSLVVPTPPTSIRRLSVACRWRWTSLRINFLLAIDFLS